MDEPQAAHGHCANCHAQQQQQSAMLSHCSRCQWVAYCSKTCQGAHWRTSHRAMCAVFQICGRFRALEANWWRSRPEHELRVLVEQHGLDPESMCFYGEVLFLLSGLKPMVVFSNLPAPWRHSFASDIITPSGVLQHTTTSKCTPALYAVGSRVETPAEYDMSGDLVLINESLTDHFTAAKASLRLQKVHSTTAEGVDASGDQIRIVSEDGLAQLLDYPVALSECREPMVEQQKRHDTPPIRHFNSTSKSSAMSASYNDWESDLSSIIEKTNQNLKLLRRIGEKRTDDVSTTGRPSASSVGNAADLRTAVHHRYAAEDAAASYRPRVMSSASGSSNRKLASTMGDQRGGAGGTTAGLRASAMLDSRRGGDANYDSDDLHSTSRSLRRSASRGGENSKSLKGTSASAGATIRVHEADMPSDIPNYVLDEIKKSLEVTISSRSSVFEKKIGDLRTDFTVLTNETTQLSHKFAELRDSVLSKMSNVPGVLQSLQENADAITRLEKHSAALLGWKVSMDQDFFEITSKVKSFTTLQDKMAALENNLESLATALKNRPHHGEKIEELRDKLSVVERHQSSFVDMKAVENLLNIRLPRELHDLEGRMNQSITFVSEKVEAKIQSLEKSLQSQRADSMASLKSELAEDIQRLSATSLRKTDIVPLQNAHAQLKEDLSQVNSFLDRQDKRIQDFKQSSTQIREELSETKQELTKALHAQQSRVAATLEDKIAQLSILSKEKNVKVDQQMAILSKKQKKVEENTKVLYDDIAKVRQDVLYKQNATHVAQQKENEKLRQRLARSVAELETLTFAKVELERRYGKQEKQFHAKLKTLHVKMEENEKLKESERLELVQKIQEETKLMGVAQGKNALLETLLAREKLQNAEKNDLIYKSRQEMNLVRQKMRTLENDVEFKMHKLTTELHSKQVQVDTLLKKLKKSEEEAAKLLENTKRDAKAFRRAKVTKEHELSIAKLKLREMEKAVSAMAVVYQPSSVKEKTSQVLDAPKRDAEEVETKRKEIEQLLLESQLQVDELNQEISEMQKQHDAAKRQQKSTQEEQISKLSSEYEVKILALNATVAAKDQAMSRLRDSLVEKSDLEALDEQLRALTNEKLSLLATIEQAHTEQTRTIQDHDTKTQLAHEKEMEAMKRNVETRMEEIDEARAGLERFKANISRLEAQLKDQESSHSEELASLVNEIKEARASIAACTTEIEELRVEKFQLDQDLESVQAELESVRSEADEKAAEMSDKLAEQEAEMQNKLDELSSQLEDKETELAESKRADESNRCKLSEMVSEQEEMERRLRSEVESLSLALDHERENSKAREQESESTILALQSDLEVIKLDSQVAKTSYQSAMVTEIVDITNSLKESQRREQQLQERLILILKEVAQASSAFDADTQADITGSEDDDAVAVKYLSHFCATQRGTLLEIENLQTDCEMAVKQAAEDAATILNLNAQVKAHIIQIQDLQAVVKQLETELKEQYANSAKQSDDLEHEISTLKKQKSDLERVVETKSSECDEKQALFDRQLESKQEQVEGLRFENEKMSATIESIRSKMESIELAKVRELDEMSATLTELEAQAAMHSVKTQSGVAPEFDKDFYANHHDIVALSQSIRSLQLKLTKSVGVLEWKDLRASVFEQEDKLEHLRQEKSREVTKLGLAEDKILLNADFLKAVLASKKSNEGDEDSDDWISKYAKTAPDMVERLRELESRLQEAMAQRRQETLATEANSAAHETNSVTDNEAIRQVEFQSSKLRVDLSESCDSDELLEESHEDLEHDHEFDEEQSFQGSLEESGHLSDSGALNESRLDISLMESAPESVSRALEEDNPGNSAVVSGDLGRIDSCTTLLFANTPPELLSTAFVTTPTRHDAQRLSSVTVESILDSSDVAHGAHDELDSSSKDESENEEPASAELQDREVGLQVAGVSSHENDECVLQGETATELSSAPSSTCMAQSESFSESVGNSSADKDLDDEASEDEESDAKHSFDSPSTEERGPPLDDAVSSDESDNEEHATVELAGGDLKLPVATRADESAALVHNRVLQSDTTELLPTSNGVDRVKSDHSAVSVFAKPSVGISSDVDDLHDEASDEEGNVAGHSFDNFASVERDSLCHDAASSLSPQLSSIESSMMLSPDSSSKPVVLPEPSSQEHCDDGTSRAQVDFEDDDDKDRDIDREEEELEASQHDESQPLSEVEANADSQKLSQVGRLKLPSAFDGHDDFAEDSQGAEDGDLDDQSRDLDSEDFDSGVEGGEQHEENSRLKNEGPSDQASLASGSEVPSTNSFQHAHEGDLDQELRSVDSEQESDDEEKYCKTSEPAKNNDEDDDFKCGAQDRRDPDAAFDSHESDEENLSEFEHFQREKTVSRAEFAQGNGVTNDSARDEEVDYAARPSTYHMEEDEESDEGDMDAVERMLLTESLAAELHSGELNQLEGEPRLNESAGECIDESADIEPDDAGESSFDDETDGSSSKSPPTEALELTLGIEDASFAFSSTHESRMEGLGADESIQPQMAMNLHDDKHHATSCDFYDEENDLMNESPDDEAAHSDSDELLERSLDDAPLKLNSTRTELELEKSCGDDGNDIEFSASIANSLDAEKLMEQRVTGWLSENSGNEHSGSDGEELVDEDQSESSFDQAPAASAFDEAQNGHRNAQDIAIDSVSSSATSRSPGGRSALLKHMSFSRAQAENIDEDDDDLDEVEQLMREQSGFAVQKLIAPSSYSNSREASDRQDETGDEERDNELIDSESDEEDDETPLGTSHDEALSAEHFDADPRSEAEGSASDESDIHAVQSHESVPVPHEEAQQRVDESQDSADDAQVDDHEESLDVSQEQLGASQEQLPVDHAPASGAIDREEALESSFDEQLLKTLCTDHEDSASLSDGAAISDSSASESESADEHQSFGDEDEEDSVDGELTSSADQYSSKQTSLSVPTQSHAEDEQDRTQQTKSCTSDHGGQDDGSDDKDEFDFDSWRMEPSLPAAPIKLQASQLIPLVQPSTRLSGAGALKKALSAATRDFDDFDDDDVDEVERLVAEQSLSRTSKPVSSKLPSSSFKEDREALGDSVDEDEFGAESVMTAHKNGSIHTDAKRGNVDDFEEHELDMSAQDDHDESFGDSQENCESRDRQGASVVNSLDEASLDELTSKSVGAKKGVEARHAPGLDASDDFRRANEASDKESDDEELDIRHASAPSDVSMRPAAMLDRNPLGFGLGRRVSLEEDDDIDEVERLLLDQTSMKQLLNQTSSQRAESTAGTRSSAFDSGNDDDDDEFGEASIGELMDAHAPSSAPEINSSVVDAHHDQRLDESHDSDREQDESLDASQQESSFEAAHAGKMATSASMESSFDDKKPKPINTAVLDPHQNSRHQVGDGGAISDSSDSEGGEEASSHLSRSPAKANTATTSLAPLGKKMAGLGLGRRAALEVDDDMDEVERLLLEQTSMKQQPNMNKHTAQATTVQHEDANESNDDDEFGEESIGALMDEINHSQQQPRTPAISSLQPIEVGERSQQQERSRLSDFDDDGGGDIDSDGDEVRPSSSRRLGELDQSDSAASSPSASSTRIPIFNGSNLADRMATDAIPTMLTGQQQPATATAVAVESEIQQQLQQLEHDESEQEEEEYLGESFDLDESLQDEDGD